MKTGNDDHRISLKAKIIFVFLPLILLGLIELTARIFSPPADIPVVVFDAEADAILTRIASKPLDRAALREYCEYQFSIPIPYAPYHQLDDVVFYRPRPRISYPFMLPDGSIIVYFINSLGFRGDEFDLEKPDDTLRIICSGDSSTFGCFNNLHDTFPERLQNMLSYETTEKNAKVINAGVIGHSSYQGLKYFETRLRILKPDILIASWGYNDSDKATTPDSKIRPAKVKTFGAHAFLNRFSTYRLLDRVIHGTKKKTGIVTMPVTKVDLKEYRENLEKLVSYCREDDIHLIFLPITVPIPYYEIMEELARENEGVGVIDMEKIFSAYFDKFFAEESTHYKGIPFGKVYKRYIDKKQVARYGSSEMVRIRKRTYLFTDNCHPTPVGYQIIAESIFDYLVDVGFFTRGKGESPKPPDITSTRVIKESIPTLNP